MPHLITAERTREPRHPGQPDAVRDLPVRVAHRIISDALTLEEFWRFGEGVEQQVRRAIGPPMPELPHHLSVAGIVLYICAVPTMTKGATIAPIGVPVR